MQSRMRSMRETHRSVITFARTAPTALTRDNDLLTFMQPHPFAMPGNLRQLQERPMIDLHYWTTPNGHKITMFLEETGLKYKIFPVVIGKGDQFKPEFLAIVLNKRLSDREFIAGDYSIADMASYPWVVPYKNQGQNIDDFPHLKRWLETIGARPATVRAYAKAKEVNPNFGQPAIRTEEERKLLFGQTAAVVK